MALLRARELVMERFRPHLRRHGVTEQQWRVLRALSSVERITAGALAGLTVLSAPSLSRILRDLLGRKLIVRKGSRTDLRSSWVSLSAAGWALLDEAAPESEAAYLAIEKMVGRARLATLYRILDDLPGRLGAEHPGPRYIARRR